MNLRVDATGNTDTTWPVWTFVLGVMLAVGWAKFSPFLLVASLALIWGAGWRSKVYVPVDGHLRAEGFAHPGAGQRRGRQSGRNAAVVYLGLTLAAYTILATLWGPDFPQAIKKAMTLLFLASGALFVHQRARTVAPLTLRAAFFHSANIVIAVLGLLIFEFLTDSLIARTVTQTFGIVTDRNNPNSGEISSYFWNRHFTLISLMIIPLLFGIWPRNGAKVPVSAYFQPIAVGLVLVIAVVLSEKETAKLALACALAALLIARVLPRTAWLAVAAAWTIASLLVFPLTGLMKAQGLEQSPGIQLTGRARIAIWEAYAERVPERPVFGHGVYSTKGGPRIEMTFSYLLPDEERPPKMTTSTPYHPRHPHNSFLQVWYELGAVGALLLWGLGVSVLLRVRAMSPTAASFGLATLAVIIVTCSLSHSLWQEWYIAAFAGSAALFSLADASWQAKNGARHGRDAGASG